MNTLQLNKRITGANNALAILSNVAGLGSTIMNSQDVRDNNMMTGQQVANKTAQQDKQIAGATISTIMSVIGTVLACI